MFGEHGCSLRMAESLRLGLSPKSLYAMRYAGGAKAVSRGVYRLAFLDDDLAHWDLVTVAKRIPQGVLCLISALSFHELTTQVPKGIGVAIERGKTKPRLDYPPTRFVWVSGPATSLAPRSWSTWSRRPSCTATRPAKAIRTRRPDLSRELHESRSWPGPLPPRGRQFTRRRRERAQPADANCVQREREGRRAQPPPTRQGVRRRPQKTQERRRQGRVGRRLQLSG